ncbi:protein kinase [Phormidium tenue FACHB-886]|nr:protein kinase [Phormidium tenue FACHB-886]
MLLDNRYQIIRTLGEGGFGQTLLAQDVQMPSNRLCVIKQLKPVTANPEIYKLVQERFQREAAILEKLGEKSKQIPSLYAYLNEGEQFYLIQEWIEGSTLDCLSSNQNPLDESIVQKILLNLLPVLEFVHTQGIIHRDIKPENIILRQNDQMPVLIDFGAVRETMGTVFNSRGSPTSSIVIGTPGYMAAEQAAGRPIPSSDLYSLGLTAIYLLTGQPPQALISDPQSGEILWHDEAHRFSAGFVEVLNKAIRSYPRDRYSSASQMLAALEEKIYSASIPPAVSLPSNSGTETAVISPAQPASISNTHPHQNRFFFLLSNPGIGALMAVGLLSGVILLRMMLSGSSSDQGPASVPVPVSSSSPPNSVVQTGTPSVPQPDGSAQSKPSPASVSTPKFSTQTTESIAETFILSTAAGSQINIYAQPTTQSASLHYGLNGDQVTAVERVQGDNGIWYFVRFASGAEGWVGQDFVRSINSQSKAKTEVVLFPKAAQLAGQSPGSRINIRAAPSTRSNSPHYGLVGDFVTALKAAQGEDGNKWYFVRFSSGVEGWVRQDFIKLQ